MSEPSPTQEPDRFEILHECINQTITEITTEFSIPGRNHQEIFQCVRSIYDALPSLHQLRYFKVQMKEICMTAVYRVCKNLIIPISKSKIHKLLETPIRIRNFHKYLQLSYPSTRKDTKKEAIIQLITESPFPDWLKPTALRLVSAYPITICNSTEKIGAATAIATSNVISAPSKEWEIPVDAIADEFGVSFSAIYVRKNKILATIREKYPHLLNRELPESPSNSQLEAL